MAAASSLMSVAEASLLIKSIDDLTECAICRETLSKPKLLPCFHTFCLGCLEKSFADHQQPGAEFPCPVCRGNCCVPDDGLEALPTHFFVEHLLDARRISKQLSMQRRCDICDGDDDDGDGDGDGDGCGGDESAKHIATSYCGECAQFLCNQCFRYNLQRRVFTLHFSRNLR